VIWDSHYWKEPLLKSARYLRRVRLNESTSERTHMRIEKELFLGFYSVRKLLDTFTVSDSTKRMQFELSFYPALRMVDQFNWHHLQKNYDLSESESETRDIRFLCNQFIHSYVFLTSEADNRIDGFFVASDRDRHTKCYFAELCHVLTAFRTVGNDYPATMHLQRDKSGQWAGQIG